MTTDTTYLGELKRHELDLPSLNTLGAILRGRVVRLLPKRSSPITTPKQARRELVEAYEAISVREANTGNDFGAQIARKHAAALRETL